MKRFSIFIFLLASISSFGQELKIPQYVQNYLEANKLEQADVYLVKNPNVLKFTDKDTTNKNFVISNVFFIDEIPAANWGHPCRYVLFDKEGMVKDVFYDNKFPFDCNLFCVKRNPFGYEEYPVAKKSQLTHKRPKLTTRSNGNSEHNYAVIINAVNRKEKNAKRFWNDCSSIYSTLVNEYGFRDENIHVIMSDGTSSADDRLIGFHDISIWCMFNCDEGDYDSSPLDLDYDGDNDIQYPTNRSSLAFVFNKLSNSLDENDNLFVFVTGHGGYDVVELWHQTDLTSNEFASYLNSINAKTITVIMENCHSGSFIPALSGNNRVIMTACNASESSSGLDEQLFQYNEFVYYWTAAMAGQYPSGVLVNADSDNDGHVSMYEAFLFAKTHDNRDEHPQYFSNPSGLGGNLTLLGDIICGTENIYNKTISIDTAFRSCKFDIEDVAVSIGKNVDFEFIEDADVHPLTHFEYGSTICIKPVSSILLEYSPDLLFSIGEIVDSETYSEVELKKLDLVQSEEESVQDDNGEEIQMKLYPNPAKSTIFVYSDLIQKIEVIDITGVKMNCSVEKNDQLWRLNVSELPEGQYFLRIRTISGNSISKTFIKQ